MPATKFQDVEDVYTMLVCMYEYVCMSVYVSMHV